MDRLLRSFDPVIRRDARLLVCGSLPGARSLAAGRYYAHPQNQFWRLMGAVIEAPMEGFGYQERLAALGDAGIGLWDVVASGRRRGSLDAAIRLDEPHDLLGLVSAHPMLRAVAFNGATAFRIGAPLLAGAALDLLKLPSSSPAYTIGFERKREQWLRLRNFL